MSAPVKNAQPGPAQSDQAQAPKERRLSPTPRLVPAGGRSGGATGKLIWKALRRITTPLIPDDYTHLIHPLWSSRELRGQVCGIRREATDAVTLVIRPGWGVEPDYQAGQYLGIGVSIDGRWVWRSYSLTEAPDMGDGVLTITVKALSDGLLSNHLVGSVKPGMVLRLAPPAGDFVLPTPPPPKILFVTAGSGITPVMGMLRRLAKHHEGALPSIVHIHSVHREEDILFRPELAAFAERFPEYTNIFRVTERQSRVDGAVVRELVPDWADREVWACGPGGMLASLEAAYKDIGRADAVHTERFQLDRSSGVSGGTVTFGATGKAKEVDGATTLLEAGEAVGLQLPFGCRMGICQTCVVQIDDGFTKSLVDAGEAGPGERIRTCVSVACGDVTLAV